MVGPEQRSASCGTVSSTARVSQFAWNTAATEGRMVQQVPLGSLDSHQWTGNVWAVRSEGPVQPSRQAAAEGGPARASSVARTGLGTPEAMLRPQGLR